MRWFRTVAAATMLAVVMGATVVITSSAEARPEPGARQGPFGCSVKHALGKHDKLRPGRALCNHNYLLRMQGNGDLVLRKISTGRACWHSNTFVPRVSATFTPGEFPGGGDPNLEIVPVLRIGKHKIVGENLTSGPFGVIGHIGTSASLNSKGEFYVGYRKVGSCRR